MRNLITQKVLDYFECAKDQVGKILNYDGTTDVVEVFSDLFKFLEKCGQQRQLIVQNWKGQGQR